MNPRFLSLLIVLLLFSGESFAGKSIVNADVANVSVVALPPVVPAGASTEQAAEAELWCDQLAEKLGEIDGVSVVDRTALAKVLEERKSAGKGQPAMSFDAMVRLAATGHFTLTDLSTGNVLARADSAINKKNAEAMVRRVAGDFAAAVKKRAADKTKRTRVRIVGVVDTSTRMTPMGNQMMVLFRQALQETPSVELVHHLESGTAAAESLLLYMGLSKLPGGRGFAPQADATLELRVNELDAIGKTFEETGIELAICFATDADKTPQWISLPATVKTARHHFQPLWQRFLKTNPFANSSQSETFFDTYALRKEQAQREYEKSKTILPNYGSAKRETVLQKLHHVETALKLDPLHEKASRMRAHLYRVYGRRYLSPGTRDALKRIQFDYIMGHDQMFTKPGPATKDFVCSNGARMSPELERVLRGDVKTVTPQMADDIQSVKQMVESHLISHPDVLGDATSFFLGSAYRGMMLTGVGTKERQVWLKDVTAKAYQQVRKSWKTRSGLPKTFHGLRFLGVAAALWVIDGQPNEAMVVVRMAEKMVTDPQCPPIGKDREFLRVAYMVVRRMNHPKSMAFLDKEKRKFNERFALVRRMTFHHTRCPLRELRYSPRLPIMMRQTLESYPWIPLAHGSGVFYASRSAKRYSVRKGGVSLAGFKLDAAGCPTGQRFAIPLPDPPKGRPGWAFANGCFAGGKFIAGSRETGLLIYDPKTKTSVSLGVDQGLPGWNVRRLFPDGDQAIAMIEGPSVGGHFLQHLVAVNPHTKEVKLLKVHDTRSRGPRIARDMALIWRDGGKINMLPMTPYGRRVQLDILGKKPIRRRLPSIWPSGWRGRTEQLEGKIVSVRAGEAFYAYVDGGLLKLDAQGRVVEKIPLGRDLEHRAFDGVFFSRLDPIVADHGPVSDQERFLWFSKDMLLFDTKENQWYGPFKESGSSRACHATEGGLFVATSRGLFFYDRQKWIAQAKKQGLAGDMTTRVSERDAAIARQKPLLRARLLMGLERWKEAEAVLEELLTKDPKNPEGFLLHAAICAMQNPANVEMSIRRLQKLKDLDDRSAQLTGWFLHVTFEYHRKKYDAALKLIQRIRSQFPVMDGNTDSWLKDIERNIKRKIARKSKGKK